jgi:flagellar biosynthesis/type III secretory pathway protein FliH
MTLGFGRVLPAVPDDELSTASRHVAPPRALGRVVLADVVHASDEARAIVARAEDAAKRLLERAENRAETLAAELTARAKTEAATALAARELAVATREAHAVERERDQLVALARLLAERLLGETLRLDPTRVVALARQTLTEARGARKLTLAVHPDDVPHLEHALATQALPPPVTVVADATRRPGSVRLDTELGSLDAELSPQLDRLAQKLREALDRA